MSRRPNSKDVDDLRKAILRVREWWKSGPSPTGFFAEAWAAAEFALEEPHERKANSPYDAMDHEGRKIGIKARAITPYTKRTGMGLNYFGFHDRELLECDAFFLIAFDDRLAPKMCLEASANVVAGYAEVKKNRRVTFTALEFVRFLDQPGVKARIPGSEDPTRWKRYGRGVEAI